MKVFKILFQSVFIYCYFFLGEAFVQYTNFPFPGSMIGFFFLFICLKFHIIKLSWVDVGAKFLTANLLLFFIPAAVGIVNYQYIFGIVGIKLIVIIFISTIVVMAATGYVADYILQRKKVQNELIRH